MLTMAVQANGTFKCGLSFVSNNLSSSLPPTRNSLLIMNKPKSPSSLHSAIRTQRRRLSAAAELAQADTIEFEDEVIEEQPDDDDDDGVLDQDSAAAQQPESEEEGPKVWAKPKLVLKFVWMEKNIGLALDQEIPGHGRVPLSPYSFWPRKDAWEDLKTALESKPWISQKKMIILLNQATDVINLWQQSGGNLS